MENGSLSAGPWKHIASNDGIIRYFLPDPEGAVTLQLIAAGDPSVSSAGCCVRGAAVAPPNEKFNVSARPKCSWHGQVHRWVDTLGSVNSQTGKLPESDREKGDKKIGRESINHFDECYGEAQQIKVCEKCNTWPFNFSCEVFMLDSSKLQYEYVFAA